ncbi:MAG: AraC family transcriptional regulator [Sporomusaceae bacterium]|nr:AraC family transcriptional regulator [Sporomusaceae bacterium]
MKVTIEALMEYFLNISICDLAVVRMTVPPGRKRFGDFTPSLPGLVFPVRGQARMRFDGVPYYMTPGRIFHNGPGMTLDKEVLGESVWEFIVVHYRAAGLRQDAADYAAAHYQFEPGCNLRVNDLLYRLHQLCPAPGKLSLRAKALFFSILDESLTCAGNRRDEPGRSAVEQAAAYLDEHYMEPLTVPGLAGQYGMSGRQFAYHFQKYAGVSPNEYLIERRLKRARELLQTTTCSVTEVSACVGYSDPFYFSKLFKKRTGSPPSAVRPV